MLLASVMDVYTIVRMFRTYTPTVTKFSGRARNVIIYAGMLHTGRYRQILQHLGFTTVYSKTASDRCLDITDLRQPVFAQPL